MLVKLREPVARLKELVDSDVRTKTAIAEAAGIDLRHLQALMKGRRSNPSIGTIERILKALGKEWADLDPSKVPEQVS